MKEEMDDILEARENMEKMWKEYERKLAARKGERERQAAGKAKTDAVSSDWEDPTDELGG